MRTPKPNSISSRFLTANVTDALLVKVNFQVRMAVINPGLHHGEILISMRNTIREEMGWEYEQQVYKV